MSVVEKKPLSEAHVVVFGGSSGLGFATAVAAQNHGANITILGRSEEKLQRAAENIEGASLIVADLADSKSIRRAFANIGRIDHLVMTAGSIHGGLFESTNPDNLIPEIDEHLKGTIYSVKAALPNLSKTGSVVMMSGQFSDRPTGNGTSVMALACRGIEAFARSLALELKPMRFNVIAPGYVETPLYNVLETDVRSAVFEKASTQIPVGRIGRPEEIADAILFLMLNKYVNCEVLHVDGGGRFS